MSVSGMGHEKCMHKKFASNNVPSIPNKNIWAEPVTECSCARKFTSNLFLIQVYKQRKKPEITVMN